MNLHIAIKFLKLTPLSEKPEMFLSKLHSPVQWTRFVRTKLYYTIASRYSDWIEGSSSRKDFDNIKKILKTTRRSKDAR